MPTQDTYKGSVWEPWTQNLYVYVANNPVNYVDPTGHEIECTSEAELNGQCTAASAYSGQADLLTDDERQVSICREAMHSDPYFFSSTPYDLGCKAVISAWGTDEDKKFLRGGTELYAAIANSGRPDFVAVVFSSPGDLVNMVMNWVGPSWTVRLNGAGDLIVYSDESGRKFRIDYNEPAPHKNPHAHLEVYDSTRDKWVPYDPANAQIYPNDVPHE